jgi:hypothetical protein
MLNAQLIGPVKSVYGKQSLGQTRFRLATTGVAVEKVSRNQLICPVCSTLRFPCVCHCLGAAGAYRTEDLGSEIADVNERLLVLRGGSLSLLNPNPATPQTHISAPDAGNLITVMEYQEVN